MNSNRSDDSADQKQRRTGFALFKPILAGATLRDRLIAGLGAIIGISLTGLLCALLVEQSSALPLIVAPMGASAVLLFAVPASPLAQPWSIIGGNTISAFIGITIATLVPDTTLAIGLAVGLAIIVMSFTRSLHPPGGASALTAVIGGASVAKLGFWFPLMPVALNSVLLVALGIAYHRATGRQYPHRPAPAPANTHRTEDLPASLRVGFNDSDIDAAIAAINETFDIDKDDLATLLREVEMQSLQRQKGETTCADIMSRDVIKVSDRANAVDARALLLEHNVRVLPVIDDNDKLIGTVGLRELAANGAAFAEALPLSPSVTAKPTDSAVSLIPKLTDGSAHAVIVTDDEAKVVGIISQTDLLATLAKSLRLFQNKGLIEGHGQGI